MFAASTSSAFGYTVNAIPLAITGVTAANKVYDGTNAAALTGGALSGVISGDTVTLVAGTGTFADANVGTNKTVTASGYALGGASAGNYTPVQPSGLTANITARPIQLTGTRVYDGTVAAGTLTIANNLDSGNLSLTGSAFLAGKDVGPQAVITSTAAPARVRSAKGNTGAGAATTISVTMGVAPAAGNTMVAVIATRGTSANIVSSITQAGVPNGTWVRAAEAHNTSMTTEIWYAPNLPAGAGTAVTINQASFLSSAVVMEYSGILAAVPLDQIAPGNSVGTSTSRRHRDDHGHHPGPRVVDRRDRLRLQQHAHAGDHPQQLHHRGQCGDKQRHGRQQRPGLCPRTHRQRDRNRLIRRHHQRSSTQWAGTIATFKASTSTLALSGSAASNYTLAGATGTVQITPKALTVTGLAATGKDYDGNATASLTGTAALPAAEAAGAGTTSDGKPYTGDTLTLAWHGHRDVCGPGRRHRQAGDRHRTDAHRNGCRQLHPRATRRSNSRDHAQGADDHGGQPEQDVRADRGFRQWQHAIFQQRPAEW